MLKRLVFALLLTAPFPALAQDVNQDGLVSYLVPINAPRPVTGAYGTQWVTELWVHNGTESPLRLWSTWCPPIPVACGSSRVHAPGVTEKAFDDENLEMLPAFVYRLPVAAADSVVLSSRLFELTRLSQPVGVELPVIREDEFFRSQSRFIAVPSAPTLRSALRIYNPRGRISSSARVEVLSAAGDPLGETVVSLPATGTDEAPGMAFILDLTGFFPQLVAVERYDVIVTPLDGLVPYWAFVAVTDNDTQQVFTITY